MWESLIPLAGKIVGGLFGRSSNRSNNAANVSSVRETNEFNREENRRDREYNREQVIDAREFDVEQISGARRWDRSQVIDARRYDAGEIRAAEGRARDYLDQDREYNSPLATRERLEAAGFNPLTSGDPSNGVSGASSTPVSAASSAIARSSAASSGVVPSSAFQAMAPVFQANNSFGEAIADAGAIYGQQLMEDQEFALRQTQVQMENARLTQIMQRASLRPSVAGPYGGSNGIVSSPSSSLRSGGSPSGDASGFSRSWAVSGRERSVEPDSNGPGLITIQNDLTGPMTVPGSQGEPWGIDELATAAVFGLPQWLYKSVKSDLSYWKGRYENRSQRTISPISQSDRDSFFPSMSSKPFKF